DTGRFWPPKRLDDDAFWAEPDGQLGAFWNPDGGFVDDAQLAAVNLAAAAQRRGVTFRFRSTVTGGRQAAGRVAGVDLAGGESVSPPVVVNVARPWSSRLNRIAGRGGGFPPFVPPAPPPGPPLPRPP